MLYVNKALQSVLSFWFGLQLQPLAGNSTNGTVVSDRDKNTTLVSVKLKFPNYKKIPQNQMNRAQEHIQNEQECIPVGCVPSAAVVVCPRVGVSTQRREWVGGCLPGVCPAGVCPGGCLPGGQCLLGGAVSTQGWGVWPGGVCQTPPVNRMTDACKNITLPQLSYGL